MVNELRVFVASPGGVEAERDAVEIAASRLNSGLGAASNVVISVRRWEQLIGGAGNPQGQINPSVDECDVFIGIVHRRWGTETGNGHDSGFGEEFARALARWETTGEPRVSLFFKQIESDSLRDPGDQLRKVLEFRESIERNHVALYNEFKTTEGFALGVYQLLAESVVASAGRDVERDSSSGELIGVRSEASDGEPISVEVATVLSDFSEVMAGRNIEGVLDFDRLQLFGLAVGHEHQDVPTHVANRLFRRRDQLTLTPMESNIWFRSYLNDLGRSASLTDRVLPFPLMIGSRADMLDLAERSAPKSLAIDEGWVAIGWLRLATALKLRPKSIWPASNSASAEKLGSFWKAASASSARKHAILYWLTVHRAGDARIARLLSADAEPDTAKLGNALLGLLRPRPSAAALAELEPVLLDDRVVRERFADQNPYATVSIATLERLAERKHLEMKIRLGALRELIRRDAVTESLIKATLPSSRLEYLIGDAWADAARAELFDRAVTPGFLTQLVALLDTLEVEPKRHAQLAMARLARHNDEVAAVIDPLLAAVARVDPDSAALILARHEGTLGALSFAEELASGTNRGANEYIELLRGAGAEADTLSFVQRSFEGLALAYISRLPDTARGRGRRWLPKIRDLTNGNSRSRYEGLELLANLFEDQDIDLLVSRLKYMSDLLRGRTVDKIVTHASLARLRRLVKSEDENVAVAALLELARRDRRPSRAALTDLLFDTLPALRLTALRVLVQGLDIARLPDVLDRYLSAPGRHFYNVVCELDRMIAEIPPTHQASQYER